MAQATGHGGSFLETAKDAKGAKTLHFSADDAEPRTVACGIGR
jgi:hypothetical protein